MSVYMDRDRMKRLNGQFVVEGTYQGKRVRLRTRDHKEALELDKSLKDGTWKPVETRSVPSDLGEEYTLAHLAHDARIAWEGMASATNSIEKLYVSCVIIGQHLPLSSLSTRHLDKLVLDLRQRRTRRGPRTDNKTINRYLSAVSKALSWACDRELLTRKPKIPWCKEGPGKLTWLREEHQSAFLTELGKLDQRFELMAKALIATGMRVGELYSLKPHQISGGWLSLDAADTKTNTDRQIPIQEALGSSLAALVRSGLPHYRKFVIGLRSASEGLGYVVTPHTLRHTTATMLTAHNVPTATVKDYLGHRSINTTLKYAHVQKHSLRHASGAVFGSHRLYQPADVAGEVRKAIENSGRISTASVVSDYLQSSASPLRHEASPLGELEQDQEDVQMDLFGPPTDAG